MTIGTNVQDVGQLDAMSQLAQRYLQSFSWVDTRAVELCLRSDAASSAHKAALRHRVQAAGIESSTCYSVLRALYFTPQHRMNMSEIGSHIQMTSASITYLVDNLEKEGVVKREGDPADRRVKAIVLTPLGEKVCASLIPAIVDLMNLTVAGFSEHEKLLFIEFLERFRQNSEALLHDETPTGLNTTAP
jgi:MarR family transcriptional regulator, 2-MHQ and catechol-resistance regulon repressor